MGALCFLSPNVYDRSDVVPALLALNEDRLKIGILIPVFLSRPVEPLLFEIFQARQKLKTQQMAEGKAHLALPVGVINIWPRLSSGCRLSFRIQRMRSSSLVSPPMRVMRPVHYPPPETANSSDFPRENPFSITATAPS